jgi:hypothetical protein
VCSQIHPGNTHHWTEAGDCCCGKRLRRATLLGSGGCSQQCRRAAKEPSVYCRYHGYLDRARRASQRS